MYRQKLFRIGIITTLAALCITGTLYAAGSWNILQKQDPEIRDYFAITFISSEEGWAVGDSLFDMDNPGFIGHTRDGGKTWEKAEIDISQRLGDIFFFDKKNGWAIGKNGMIVGTNDGGKKWEIQTSKVGNWLYGVHFPTEKIGYAVGMSETIVQTTNGGKTWKVLRGGEGGGAVGDDDTSVFNAAYFFDESTGWVAGVKLSPSTGGQDGLIQKTTDGGKNWVDQPTNIEDIIKDIWFVNASTGWAEALCHPARQVPSIALNVEPDQDLVTPWSELKLHLGDSCCPRPVFLQGVLHRCQGLVQERVEDWTVGDGDDLVAPTLGEAES